MSAERISRESRKRIMVQPLETVSASRQLSILLIALSIASLVLISPSILHSVHGTGLSVWNVRRRQQALRVQLLQYEYRYSWCGPFQWLGYSGRIQSVCDQSHISVNNGGRTRSRKSSMTLCGRSSNIGGSGSQPRRCIFQVEAAVYHRATRPFHLLGPTSWPGSSMFQTRVGKADLLRKRCSSRPPSILQPS